MDILGLIEDARSATPSLANLSTQEKNQLLLRMADSIEKNTKTILEANLRDLAASKLSKNVEDRLLLTEDRIRLMAQDVRKVATLPDPVGEEKKWTVPSGLTIHQNKVPFGVIGVIYENRPNVTIDIASLCLKSGNSCILRGSASALTTNRTLVKAIEPILPKGAVCLVDSADRSAVEIMLKARGKIDLLIPRGGAELINHVVQNSRVPIIETGTGNCHVYVDETADLTMAEKIIINAKCQRPSVCNAEEKLLVHKKIAAKFIPRIVKVLRENKVEVRGCSETKKIIPDVILAKEEDWSREYLDLIIAIRVVSDVDEAIVHINKYNSKHTEAIITKNKNNADKFTKNVDAAVVMVNASTRFTDGGQFGFGAEVGISTQKLHSRGPMGLEALTCTKYIVEGTGQIRN
ncbi:D-glyceraldehyde dehydrogenase (NADP(+)) [Candidatus Bilamarchaeum dharawalense]|uniref:Gamma-glutamyl phosphate reductase n=1 Tax=Candidatus Bilamarchaeum dharawalense TaxID=2885759 RepID=A0A5E4LR75_9ARCH|nr:D-glyceraldehyde dehydrogenase (NADP(+)) [Candidatus Bilamarchaeum dharawalense]